MIYTYHSIPCPVVALFVPFRLSDFLTKYCDLQLGDRGSVDCDQHFGAIEHPTTFIFWFSAQSAHCLIRLVYSARGRSLVELIEELRLLVSIPVLTLPLG